MTLLHPTIAVPAQDSSNRAIVALGLVSVLLAAALMHGINMMSYPYYENDEGTYVSQAWSVLHQGSLAPYTYWYDHSPVGWFQLAALTALFNLEHLVPSGVPAGRVLMLLYQVASVALVFMIVHRGTGRLAPAIAAALLFALSPFGTYYHRRVLLDNVATVWLLLSIWFLLAPRLRPVDVWLSAVSIGIAVLSKELMLFVIPGLAVLVALASDRERRMINFVSFVALSGAVISVFPLLAILKGELVGSPDRPGVSLICTVLFQAGRGKDGGLLDPGSQFWTYFTSWARQEPILTIGGTLAAFAGVLSGPRMVRLSGIAALSLWAFLARGGMTMDFYLVPLLPLLAISLTGIAWQVALVPGGATSPRSVMVASAVCLVVASGVAAATINWNRDRVEALLTGKEADAIWQALAWVRANADPGHSMLIDQSMWLNLHDGIVPPVYPNAHYYWKAEKDPTVRELFEDGWKSVRYAVVTQQMRHDARFDMPLLAEVLAHGRPVATFDTGGWRVDILEVDPDYVPAPATPATPGTRAPTRPASAPAAAPMCS